KKNLQSLLNCNFGGILARDLGSMRQTPAGAVAGGQLFEHAFIATLKKSGRPGIYRRKTKKRFPVKSVTIPIFDEATKIIEELAGNEAAAVFEKRFRHEISRLTGMLL
ncbi:MAG: phage tail protein, partial [Holosporaceae bacterium]|nr:phage tail protein [Holosporaceae bacterium]